MIYTDRTTFSRHDALPNLAQEVLSGFEQAVADWAEVRECHMIRGGGDFLLKVVAKDKEHRDELTMRITSTAHVSRVTRSEEHTSELQSLMRTSYAVICLKKKNDYRSTIKPKSKINN